jgi:putative transposase
MPEYRQAKIAGGSYFFTVVTYNRLPILTGEIARSILHSAWMDVCYRFPFKTDAVVLLPNPMASSGSSGFGNMPCVTRRI